MNVCGHLQSTSTTRSEASGLGLIAKGWLRLEPDGRELPRNTLLNAPPPDFSQRARVAPVVSLQSLDVAQGFLFRRSGRIDHWQFQPVQQFNQEQAGNATVEILERMDVQQTPFGKER